uniref:hypothetical protein n=1 Tax=Yoonia sp. TaxID=2212373 RepID=UPI004047F36B
MTQHSVMAAALARLRAAGFDDAQREVRLLWRAAMPHRFVDDVPTRWAAIAAFVVPRP